MEDNKEILKIIVDNKNRVFVYENGKLTDGLKSGKLTFDVDEVTMLTLEKYVVEFKD